MFPERNFVLDLGVATLAVLDTNRPLGAALAAGLRRELDRAPRPWLVMAAHHVWRTYGDKPGQRHGQVWARELGRDPDLWLNGHAHFLQFGEYPGAVDGARRVAALTSGAAGKLRPQVECAHAGAGAGLPPGAEDGELFGRSRYGYAVVDLTPTRARVVFKDATGAPLFVWERGRGDVSGTVVALGGGDPADVPGDR